MPNFQNGKIYKIFKEDIIYIGSTTLSLRLRFNSHIHLGNFTREYNIELIEDYPCDNNKILTEREQYWIENTNCINKKKAFITEEERKEKSKLNASNHYYNNKDKKLEYQKEYRLKNKEEIDRKQQEKASEKLECSCGRFIRRDKMKKHLDNLNSFHYR